VAVDVGQNVRRRITDGSLLVSDLYLLVMKLMVGFITVEFLVTFVIVITTIFIAIAT